MKGYGLEIGGSSGFFRTELPVYAEMEACDNVNFAKHTIWGDVGEDYIVDGKKYGKQYISEATDLRLTEKYDFVLSSNVIEHIANPLKAVREWINVLKPGGVIVIVAPKKESNFDHRRAITDFSHLIRDFENNIGEDDLTHLPEILELHDLPLDPPAGTLQQFTARSLKNIENRCLHHHVFDLDLLLRIYEYFDVTPIRSIKTEKEYCLIGQI
jgi:SAM-dependent methyltransferase